MLDDGPETVIVWPEVDGHDSRGNPARVTAPDDQAVTVQAWCAPVGSDKATIGQTITTEYNVWAPSLPTGPWGKVHWDGRDWDLQGEISRFNNGQTRVNQALIKARTPRAANG